jgi:nucleoside-diphosphate-sugar epimerase
MSENPRILILGGTSFIGRAIVQQASAHDAEITLFTRGRTGTDLFPQVTRLTGDRDGDYSALAANHGDWDAVVDTTGYLPRHVGLAMDVLGDRVGRYLFLSSHAVYQVDGVGPGSTEDTPRRPPVRDVPDTSELTDATYGPSKVACEQDVTARYGDRATIVRPGKVAGPHDNQRGLTYYVRRAARGGPLPLPGDPGQPVQLVDSRDLAALVVRLIEDDRPGAFHAVGPEPPITLGGLIRVCAETAGTEVEIVPVPADAAAGFFPLVRPAAQWATQQRSPARARAVGLPATPIEATIADVRAWDRGRGEPPLADGFTPDQEAAALGAIARADG